MPGSKSPTPTTIFSSAEKTIPWLVATSTITTPRVTEIESVASRTGSLPLLNTATVPVITVPRRTIGGPHEMSSSTRGPTGVTVGEISLILTDKGRSAEGRTVGVLVGLAVKVAVGVALGIGVADGDGVGADTDSGVA